MEYLHVFESETDYNTARSNNYSEPWVSATNIGGGGSSASYRVNYNKSEYEKLLETPLTFEITSTGNIGFSFSYDYSEYVSGFTIEYKKNGGEWTEANVTTDIYSISVLSGDTVQFRGNNSTYCVNYDDEIYFSFDHTDCRFKLNGNIMSLLNKDNFALLDTLQSAYTFYSLFSNCTGLTDASKLVLPATTLSEGCYSWMFYNCTSLTTAPALPATTLADWCYQSMFEECSNLTSAPELPATTLAESCYYEIFRGCTSLTTAPELPATTLANECYSGMFYGCSSLTTAPELPATTLANECYSGMFYGCSSLTTAPELPATTLAESCYGGMFANTNVLPDCSNIDFTSATVVASGGLRSLFSGTKVTDNDLRQILPINPNTNNYYLPATTLASSCYSSMFYNCTSLTTAPELPATTLANRCYGGMFQSCTNLTTAPALPATTLANECYRGMFNGCSSLNYIKAMFTTTPSFSYTGSWVSGVASTGTFVKNSAATWDVTGTYGIPSGWTVQTATS